MTLRKVQIVDEVHRYMFWDSRKKIFDVSANFVLRINGSADDGIRQLERI
jgi:hypothetical protein